MVVMHIITRLNRGGTSTWLKILTESNLNGFNQLIVFGQIDKFEIEDSFYRNREFHRIKFLHRKINPVKDFLAYFELKKVIKDYQPDIINTHTFKAGLLGRLAARNVSKQIKLVHTFHGHLIYGYYGKFQSLVFLKIEKWLAQFTNILITNGSQTKKDLVLSGIAPNYLFKVILPGIKIKSKLMSNNSDIRAKYKIAQSDIVVGWLGRLTNVKNPELVLRIATLFPEVKFLIGGEGQLLENLKRTKIPNVIFLGWVDPIIFWRTCDIALSTSKNEAAPYSLIEALSCGLPVISSDVGSVRDVITSKNGFLVSNFDNYVTAIRILLKNKKKRINMSKQSKLILNHKFSQDKFTSEHLIIYSELK